MNRSEEVALADKFLAAFERGELTTKRQLVEALTLKWFRLNTLYKIQIKEPTENKAGEKTLVVRFRPNRAQKIRYIQRHNRDLILKARQLGFCVDPETRVLTADLRWIAIKDLLEGQEIVAVDEHTPGGKGKARKMRTATVQKVGRVYRKAYRITFDDGRSVICTDQHPWLTRKIATDAKWRSLSGKGNQVVGKIDVGTKVRWVAKPWEEGDYEDGWMGGMLDGEGSMAKTNVAASVNVSQVVGPVLARMDMYLQSRGYSYRTEIDDYERPSKHGKTPVHKLVIGRMDEMFRLLGTTRPSRFAGNRFWEGRELPGKRNGGVGWATVTEIEELGEQEMIDLQTSTGTYIAEGFVSHNTTFEMIDALDDCLFTENFKAGCIAHTLDDAKDIFRNKIKFAYEHIPEVWKAIFREIGLAFPLPTSDKGEGYVFDNNSSIRVSTSYRGGTLQRLHVSEFGKICRKYPEKAEEIVSGAFEAVPLDGQITIESTAEGRQGRFYEYSTEAEQLAQQKARLTGLDFKFHFFPWWEEPDYSMDPKGVVIPRKSKEYFSKLEKTLGITVTPGQRAWYVKKEKVLKDKMKREYPSTPKEAFEQAIEGAYYTDEMAYLREHGQIRSVPYDHRLPVYTFWDLGRNDFTAIWFMQYAFGEYRLIRYLEDNGHSIQWYCRKLREFEYHYSTFYLPHDADVTDLSSADNMSRKEIVESMGFAVEVVPRVAHKNDAIQAVRDILPLCWFDEEHCADGIAHLDAHRRKWNEQLGHWMDEPFRGPDKHAADALEQMARGFCEVEGLSSYEPEYG